MLIKTNESLLENETESDRITCVLCTKLVERKARDLFLSEKIEIITLHNQQLQAFSYDYYLASHNTFYT